MSTSDKLINQFDKMLRSIIPGTCSAERPSPAANLPATLDSRENRHSAGLMRVNHSGEVCAQALYHGQAFTAKTTNVKTEMQQAAIEEQDHLVWCEQRLNELNSHTSILNPLWYSMSFALGATAGLIGDKYSLGFVVETERQVSKHLIEHMASLPKQDTRSYAVLDQMNIDELKHRDTAQAAGAVELPLPVKQTMTFVSKLMTHLSYYI